MLKYKIAIPNNPSNDNPAIFEKIANIIKSDQSEEQLPLKHLLASEICKDFDINFVNSQSNTVTTGNRIETDTFTKTEETLLHRAIFANNLSALKVLIIDNKANLNIHYRKELLISQDEYDSYGGRRIAHHELRTEKEEFFPLELTNDLPIALCLAANGAEYSSFGKLKGTSDFKLRIITEQRSYLRRQNQLLKENTDKLKKENTAANSRLENYKYYLGKSKDFIRIVTLAQAAVRGYLARKDYKSERLDLKRKRVEQNEKQASEIIINHLAKRGRFNEIKELCDLINLDSPIKVYEQISLLKSSIERTKTYFLLLGEGNFSFACSLIAYLETKQKQEIKLIASDINTFDQSEKLHPTFKKNKAVLEAKENVTMMENVDATKLDSDQRLKKESARYKRIYFNCPHDGKTYLGKTLPKLVSSFFQTARALQKTGDKIYMLLPKEEQEEKKQWRYTEVYDIYKNAAEAGYVYYKKRNDIDKRYPSYQHAKTKESGSACHPSQLREHIFKCSDYSQANIRWIVEPDYFKNKETLPEISSVTEDSSQDGTQPSPVKFKYNKT